MPIMGCLPKMYLLQPNRLNVPLFSVIIPLYNKESHIALTLQSLFAQTFTDFEVIVVDDGSNDKGGQLVQDFAATNLTYIYTENRGVSAARNTGIKAATGKIIAFLDSDDLWDPNHLEELYKLHFDFPEAGLLISRYVMVFSKKKIIQPVFKNLPAAFRGIVPDFFEASTYYRVALTSATALPKWAFDMIGLFNENLNNGEDTDIWIKAALKYPVALGNQNTVHYNFYHPDSLSKKDINTRTLPDFAAFEQEEVLNTSLKKFLDMYRLEYAINLKTVGNIKWKDYYAKIQPENIPLKHRIAFLMPSALLRLLKKVRKFSHF